MTKNLIAIAIIVSSLFSASAFAWDDCPYGKVNDEYPGDCSRYVDTDEDGICDRSQPAPEDRAIDQQSTDAEEELHDLVTGQGLKNYTVVEIAEIYQIDATEYSKALSDYYKIAIKEQDSFQLLHDNYGLEPSAAKDIATSIKTGQRISPSESAADSKRTYHLLPISLFILFLYAVSKFLLGRKILSVINHRKIWNVLLLLTFLISGILSILLVVRVNFDIAIALPFNILFWHVEFGIAMITICILHIIERRHYFLNLFSFKRQK